MRTLESVNGWTQGTGEAILTGNDLDGNDDGEVMRARHARSASGLGEATGRRASGPVGTQAGTDATRHNVWTGVTQGD